MKRIAIAGVGFSGAAAAYALLRRHTAPFELLLIEPEPVPGAGLAYGRARPGDLLNVAADRLSIDADAPGDFASWLAGQGDRPYLEALARAPEAAYFAPRRQFARYSGGRLNEALAVRPDVVARRIPRPLTAVEARRAGGYRLTLADTEIADCAVLIVATGYGMPAEVGRYGRTAFAPPRGLNPVALGNVIIIGSGLSMVDTLLDLRARGFDKPALVISRHGLLPRAHAAERRRWRSDEPLIPPVGARQGLRLVRRLCREAAVESADWRAVIDRFRPQTQDIWAGWNEAEQRRFLRHIRPYWDVFRHRLPPSSAAAIQAELAAGTLCIRAGRVLDMAVGERSPASGARHRTLAVAWRGQTRVEALEADLVVDCTGHFPSLRAAPVAALLAAGLAEVDVHGWGLRVARDGAVLSGDRERDDLYAVGPLGLGSWFELIAVPEIIVQAAEMAGRLAGRA